MDKEFYHLHMDDIRRALPVTQKVFVPCPVEDCDLAHNERNTSLFWMIVDLNDSHEWSRERIADWLDTLDIDLTFPLPSK